jgi:membrane protease YdiL (CAAX protease family)
VSHSLPGFFPPQSAKSDGTPLFFALACAITWTCDLPVLVAALRGVDPPPYALPLAGLGAFGPTLAALLVARRLGSGARIFGPWRARPALVLLALFTPLLLHLLATLIERALGGHPAHWFYFPSSPERLLALAFFSLGEEPGWRGFAQPRLVQHHGPVRAALVLGTVWTFWHIPMFLGSGPISIAGMCAAWLELTLYSILFIWFAARTGGSLTIALALHAGAHLDNTGYAPQDEVRLRVLRLLVLFVAAALAARTLDPSARRSSTAPAQPAQ